MGKLLLLVIIVVVRIEVCTNVISKLVVIVKRGHGEQEKTSEGWWRKGTDGQTEDGTDGASKVAELTCLGMIW